MLMQRFRLWPAVLRMILPVACILLGATALPGQIKDDRPRLILNTGGPAGMTNRVVFSADSKRLFAGGLDKVVHVWNVDARKRPDLVKQLHGEIARGFLGVVYAMDAVPVADDGRIAIAGTSVRNGGGDVVIYDGSAGEVARVLPSTAEREKNLNSGHQQPVVSVSWSPDGRRLISVSRDEEVRVWSAPDWSSRLLRPASTTVNTSPEEALRSLQLPALFLDNTTAAVAERLAGSADWRVAIYNAATGERTRVQDHAHQTRVTALARAPEGKRWVSADAQGGIFLWTGTAQQTPRTLRPAAENSRVATALSFGPDDRLAVSNEKNDQHPGLIELWNVADGQKLDEIKTADKEHNLCCVISRDGSRLATHKADTHEVLLFSLKNAAGQYLAKPLSQAQPMRLEGRGRGVYHVAFADDGEGYQLGFGNTRKQDDPEQFNEYGTIERMFHLSKPNLFLQPGNRVWRSPDQNADGWQLEADATRGSITLNRGGLARGTITLDPKNQGQARCYCFIPDADGKPVAVAIGTNVQFGVFVYELPQQEEAPRLLRYFRDHQGTVLSLSASKDGKYLASGADDQTIKVWSLANLFGKPGEFPKAGAWGANFQVTPNGVEIASVMEGGIALARGLKQGDLITVLWVTINGKQQQLKQPAEIHQALSELKLHQTVILKPTRAGKQLDWILLVPAWEPLATLFVDVREEWALWTPEGYYDSSVGEGNELFGWQINRGPGVTPRILKAAELQKEFEKPMLLRRLLSAGNLPAAFRAANLPLPENLQTRVADVADQVPGVQIVSPKISDEFRLNEPITLTAAITYPETRRPEEFTVRAFVNGFPLKNAPPAINGREHRFTWTTTAPDAFNLFRVKVEETNGGVNGLINVEEVAVKADAGQKRYRIHVLAIAANDYLGLAPLRYAVPDAQTILNAVEDKQGDFYEVGLVRTLFNEDVTRDNLKRAIDEFRVKLRDAGPNDLLVLFVAGHGFAFGPEYYYVPPAAPDFSRDTLESIGISWEQLCDLVDVPCRKVVLLDTCHSGNVLLEELEKADLPQASQHKAALDPLKRAEFLVVTATSTDEEAIEGADFGGHGAFTKSLIDGLDGLADGLLMTELGPEHSATDGIIALQEMIAYVTTSVRKSTNGLQRPKYTPSALFNVVEVPLVRYELP